MFLEEKSVFRIDFLGNIKLCSKLCANPLSRLLRYLRWRFLPAGGSRGKGRGSPKSDSSSRDREWPQLCVPFFMENHTVVVKTFQQKPKMSTCWWNWSQSQVITKVRGICLLGTTNGRTKSIQWLRWIINHQRANIKSVSPPYTSTLELNKYWNAEMNLSPKTSIPLLIKSIENISTMCCGNSFINMLF